MNLRRALHEQAVKHGLDAPALSRLYQLARLTTEPARLQQRWPAACAIAGGVFIGMAAIMWVAANWMFFGRFGRLLLAEAFVLAPLLLMLWRAQWRLPMALLALLAIGALFACMGQTYQTGADPWQLFAVWALLGLPLCLGVQHEAAWLPWVLIVATAFATAQPDMLPRHVFLDGAYRPDHAGVWVVAAAFAAGFQWCAGKKWGIGKASSSLALVACILLIAVPAMDHLLHHSYALFLPAVVILTAAAGMLATRAFFNAIGMCLALLVLNALLGTALLISLSGANSLSGWIATFLLTAILTGGLLLGSLYVVKVVFKREGVLP